MEHCHARHTSNELEVPQVLFIAHSGVRVDLQRVVVSEKQSYYIEIKHNWFLANEAGVDYRCKFMIKNGKKGNDF